MLNYFPKYFSTRAIICYLVTLALVSVAFLNHAMPFQFMLFGLIPVLVFFVYGFFGVQVTDELLFDAGESFECALRKYQYYNQRNGNQDYNPCIPVESLEKCQS